MRRLVALGVLVLAAGCSSSGAPAAGTPVGCGLLPQPQVVGVVGDDTASRGQGSVSALRDDHLAASCRTVDEGDDARYVTVRAMYHPTPYELPKRGCSEGWVYAGTPEKYTPACQEFADGQGRTELIVRWQPFVMRIAIGRPNKDWGGDPERALKMSRDLAQRLSVQEAEGEG
ncbi:MAG: hypothetical protein HOQ22_00365 [Nocardioidaceae bacterium]|nr:hypothetical protein [Nocardioidaceae bacterium]NUS49481.1 hypothetical protein [Nocardioidaceae bacterium]